MEMVRPKILENAKQISLVLDHKDFEIVEQEKGTDSFSGYIRMLIRNESYRIEGTAEKKLIERNRKIAKLEHESENYRTQKQKYEDSNKTKFIELQEDYTLWSTTNAEAKGAPERHNWIESRAKAVGIKPYVLEAHLMPQGLK